MNIFAQAAANLPLSPAQRAFLKLLEGFFWAGFVAAAQAFVQYLSPDGYVNWPAILHTALIAGSVAFLLAVAKYYKSHGDVASQLVASVATQAAQSLESANPTLYNRPEQGTTSNPTGDAATVAVTTSDTPAAA